MLVIIMESTFVARHHSKNFSYMISLSLSNNYAKCLLLPTPQKKKIEAHKLSNNSSDI